MLSTYYKVIAQIRKKHEGLTNVGLMLDHRLSKLSTYIVVDPLSPHDAIKHHVTSLKTYLIFIQLKTLK